MDIIRRAHGWVLLEYVDATGWHYVVVSPSDAQVCTTDDLVHAHEVMNGIRDECKGSCLKAAENRLTAQEQAWIAKRRNKQLALAAASAGEERLV